MFVFHKPVLKVMCISKEKLRYFYHKLNTSLSTITSIVIDQHMNLHSLLNLSTKPLHEDNISSC